MNTLKASRFPFFQDLPFCLFRTCLLRFLLPVAIALLYGVAGNCQDSIVDQDVRVNQQFWIDYNPSSQLSEYRTLSTQFAFRKITPEVYNRFQVISTLDFKNKRNKGVILTDKPLLKSYRLGGGAIYTQNNNADDNMEFRLFQGLTFDIPTIKQVTLNNFARIEERLQRTFGNSGWKTGFRFRYRLSTRIALDGLHLDFTEGFYIPLEAEIFMNLKKTDRFNDLLRLSPGIGYRFKSDWRIESYLIFNRQKNITETNNSSNDFILRLRLYSPPNRKYQGTGDLPDTRATD